MAIIGIRELKNHLSYYLAQVKKGRTIHVAERGHQVALIIPLPRDTEEEALWGLVRAGHASWSGGKPQGSRHPVKLTRSSIARAVIEDRR